MAIVLLSVDPLTGRTHQIRIHASDAGAPLVGDRDYGGPTRIVLPNGTIVSPSRIALHAARVVVPGPQGEIEARAPVPTELAELWSRIGGDPAAWARAVDAVL
jgi:23S rRNA-/tRNA-specific pseudouridylate synthase